MVILLAGSQSTKDKAADECVGEEGYRMSEGRGAGKSPREKGSQQPKVKKPTGALGKEIPFVLGFMDARQIKCSRIFENQYLGACGKRFQKGRGKIISILQAE